MERNILLREIYDIGNSTPRRSYSALIERKANANWRGDFLQEVSSNFNVFGEVGGGRIQNKKDPVPSDITTIVWKGVKTIEIHKVAKAAWEQMVAAARADGIDYPLLMPTSGYRSSAHQKRLWETALRKYGTPEKARKWVAPPGGSAHQSGRAFDLHLSSSVKNSSENALNGSLRRTKAYQWLEKNALRFSFYPYSREPWHWEYNPFMGTQLSISATSNSDTSTSVPTDTSSALVSAVAFNNRHYSSWSGDEYAIYQFLGVTDRTPSAELFAQMLMNWQQQNGLAADGKLGSTTLAKLKLSMKSAQSTPSSSQGTTTTTITSSSLAKAIRQNKTLAQELGWDKYMDKINDLLLPYSGQSNVSLGEEDFVYALMAWQRSKGLKDDGVLGKNTWTPIKHCIRNEELWHTMTLNGSTWTKEADTVINNKFIPNIARYKAIATTFQNTNSKAALMPWWFIACIHSHESGSSFSRHLHNGDPLTDYTKQVPAGRPQVGHGPPFTFEESAIDALTYEGFGKVLTWDFFHILYLLEKYNGFGYANRGINTPYIWSGTNHYTKGKFVKDGVFDANFVSKQVGIAIFLERMVVRGII